MYRKLVVLLLVALVAGMAVRAWMSGQVTDPGDTHLQMLMGRLQSWGLFRFRSEWGLALVSLLKNAFGFGAGLLLARGAAFNPARRPSPSLAFLRYTALGCALGYTLFFLYDMANATGLLAALYGRQTGQSPLLALASALPHRLMEAGALLLVLAAPIFVVARSAQVLSLRQASFEGWLEAKKRWRWSLLLLAVAAATEVYVTPAVTTFLLR